MSDLDAWIAGLRDPDPEVQCRAALALGKDGDASAVPFLILALQTTDLSVTRAAAPRPGPRWRPGP